MRQGIFGHAVGCAVIFVCAACTTPDNRPRVHADAGSEAQRVAAAMRTAPAFQISAESYVKAQRVDYTVPRDAVSLEVSHGSVVAAITSLAQPRGYAVVLATPVTHDELTIALHEVDFERAVREIAAAAGCVAVFDHARHGIFIGREALYTFLVPEHILRAPDMHYTVTSNPADAALASQPGLGTSPSSLSGGLGGATPVAGAAPTGGTLGGIANMRVTGRSGSALQSFIQAVREIAGPEARVTLLPESGLLAVRGDGQALKRVSGFIETFVTDATRQIFLKAALIDVTLTDEMAYGIDWSRMLFRSHGDIKLNLSTANIVGNPAASATVTGESVRGVINALQAATKVNVVAEPQLIILNHQPGIMLNATQKPVLANVQTTVSGNAAIATTSAALSYVQDGVSLAFTPHSLDNLRAELTVMPFLANAVNPQQFQPGAGLQLSGFDLPTTASHFSVLVETGKTYIIGGSRFTQQNYKKNGIPGVANLPGLGAALSGTDDTKSARELVLLIHADISAPPPITAVVGEAL